MSFDVIENWHKELEVMNHNKRGKKFDYPNSFMKLLGYARVYFGLPFRQTEGMIRAYCNKIPAVPDFTSIHKRVNKLDITIIIPKTILMTRLFWQLTVQELKLQTEVNGF